MNALINGINGIKPPVTPGLTIPQYQQPTGYELPKGHSVGTGQTRFNGFSTDSTPFQHLPTAVVPTGIADKQFNTFANTGIGMNFNMMG
jgi:hypothetical protein